MRVYLEALGCRLNSAEVEDLARQVAGAGHEVVQDPIQAEVIVLNSCAVTAQAARKSQRRLRALHRDSPAADLAVTGCWATVAPERVGDIEGVRWVVPNVAKTDTVAQIIIGEAAQTSRGPKLPPSAAWGPGRWGHTRAFLGVQAGCDHACTYCVTRLLRGPGRSRPLREAMAAVHELVEGGAQEVVLTGISLGAYGRDLGIDDGLARLVGAVLTETDLPRLRLSSIEPWDVSPALLKLWENPRLCRQLHLPLQSGSDQVLRRMGRSITTDAYRALVVAARDVSPDIAITTDIITGFPGETETDHAATLSFIEACGFAMLHVFPYSERPGTPAARLPGRVDRHDRKTRARQVRALGKEMTSDYRARFVGATLEVLWEPRNADDEWVGWTDNYLEVRTRDARDLYNRITTTRLADVGQGYLVGQVLLG